MLQHWVKVKDIDGAYWTLAVEMMFYLIMFVLLLVNQLKNIVLWGLLWLMLCLITFEFKCTFKKYLVEVFILNHAPLFISGIMFYQLKLGQIYIYPFGNFNVFDIRRILSLQNVQFTYSINCNSDFLYSILLFKSF